MRFGEGKPNREKLLAFGFCEREDGLFYEKELLGDLLFRARISGGEGDYEIYDAATGEPYTLHLLPSANGPFVGSVRDAADALLSEIGKCFDFYAFPSVEADEFAAHILKEFGESAEFLWADLPDCCIWRRADNRKWYAVLMPVLPEKLGLKGRDPLVIIDVRAAPERIDALVDGVRYFRGWHMNKKHWLTLPLDGRLSSEEIFSFLRESRELAKK